MDSTITITDVAELDIPKKIGTQKCNIPFDFDDRKPLRETTIGGKSDKMNTMGWESLPLLVFRVLFPYIDYRTKLQLRQVCSNWLDIVELEVGLNVEVYESDKDNISFINSVKIKELHLNKCFVPQVNRLLQPSEIEVLGLYGTTCPNWFHFKMKDDFALIKKLILRGKAISYLELGKILGNNQKLFNTKNVDTAPSLIFEHLEKLEIIADSCSFPLDDAFFSSQPVLTPMNQNIVRAISADIAQNICYFLNNIRSRELKAVKIYSYQLNVPEYINWKCNPLERFLESHAKSLEKLLLPEFSGENENSHSNRDLNCIPMNLNTLRIYLCCFLHRNRFGGVQNPIYWLKLILNQHRLENLSLEMACFPQNFMTPLMNSIISKNHVTLRRISLNFTPAEWTVVNGNIFSSCHILESLKILKHVETRPINLERSTFINLIHLPSSLKTLELTGFLISTVFLDVSKFSKLCHLVLQVVVADTSISSYQRNVQMITNFLNLRQLNYFDFYIAKPLQTLSLTKIKNFVYRSKLLKEHILNVNYISSLSIDYGMQILITGETATIRYAPSICRMYNPESNLERDTSFIPAIEEHLDIIDNELEMIEIRDDENLIATVQHDLGLDF